jgi:hypothetical protein
MRKFFVVAISVVTISGCASYSSQVIDSKTEDSIRNQTVVITTRKKPDFAASTAGNAILGGLFGSAVMIIAGNALVEENSIPDPADAIAKGLAKAFEATYGTRLIDTPIPVNSGEPADIADAVKSAASFVVDVQTTDWGFIYFPTDWTHYRIIYTAKARLIDVAGKSVVAEGYCMQNPKDNEDAPTYDELLANKASLLKGKLALIADECVGRIRDQMLAASK